MKYKFQATISTLGSRINEVVLPVPLEKAFVTRIVKEVSELVNLKVFAREKMEEIRKLSGGGQ